MHLVDQDTISAASDTVSTTPATSAPAPAPEASPQASKPAQPEAAAAAPAASAPVAAAEIKPSTPLAGEEDLANRTLDWKYTAPAAEAPKASKPKAKAAPKAEATPDYDGDGVLEGENEGTRPEALSAAREGGADDLKRIKGIGPKLEKLCNELGFYHFDQIAGWSADEVAWVNANLAGFKGRVSRDNWVEQAKLLASGEETEFSKRVDKGGVY
jgi:predicted flap endonuclease-1-like 5' DNA nuclease